MTIKRGDVVAYWQEPDAPLKAISEPYSFNGQQVVTLQRVARKKVDRKQGIYAVDGLIPYTKKQEEGQCKN